MRKQLVNAKALTLALGLAAVLTMVAVLSPRAAPEPVQAAAAVDYFLKIDGVWSLLKRSIIGSFHHVSVKHLNAYLDELEWRFSNRNNPFMFRDTMRELVLAENLQYRDLTA